MKKHYLLIIISSLSLAGHAQQISPGANYAASNSKTVGGLSVDWILGSINTQTNLSVLPVKLIKFTATKQENIAILTWETAEETNSDHFEIQRSGDGKSWEALAEVKARGESKTTVTYNYTDNAPLNGENLYRLKMIDTDGTFAYSRIASLEFEGTEMISVYPNPFTSKLHIELPDWTKYHQIEIYNANGRALPIALVPGPDANKKAFDMGNAPSGVYLIKATRQNGSSVTTKVIKR